MELFDLKQVDTTVCDDAADLNDFLNVEEPITGTVLNTYCGLQVIDQMRTEFWNGLSGITLKWSRSGKKN